MGGQMGRCPDWYAYVRAARYCGAPVYPATNIADMPQWWVDKLLTAEAAEMEARAMAAEMAGGGGKREQIGTG